ncbi:DUF1653 domain-containing protein [Streptomyces sp. NPDC048297]|uniref:DUF1653 domain-containing protein n=1 Tax=Streptomyces sp. NPDC048297 TaxID=3365531 RepID=UPI0037193AAB
MELPQQYAVYQHYKGRCYQFLAVGRHTETGEELAVYRQLYGDGLVWARPLSMFCDKVLVEGVSRPRYLRVEDPYLAENPATSAD